MKMFKTLPPRIQVQVPPERNDKINLSIAETENMTFRPVNCPYCGIYLFDVFEDIKGHIAVKCHKCKGVVPINSAYFRRLNRRGYYRNRQRK